jgi:hypothetical protein
MRQAVSEYLIDRPESLIEGEYFERIPLPKREGGHQEMLRRVRGTKMKKH